MASEKGQIHVNDVGTNFTIELRQENDTVYDISDSNKKEFWFEKPDGVFIKRDGEYCTDGKDGKLQYITASGDLDQQGNWGYMIYIEKGPNINHSNIKKFKVWANLPLT